MAQALRSIDAYPDRTVEIVVHITETLGEQRREDMVSALQENTGITAAEFCPLRYHLMLVRYDRDMYSSKDVLARVESQGVNARLIGPV
jgi:hypothetical protein